MANIKIEPRMDANGTVYMVDEEDRIVDCIDELTVVTTRDGGLYKNTITMVMSDFFGKIEPIC